MNIGGLFDRLKDGLSRTRDGMVQRIQQIAGTGALNDELYENLEAVLLQADVGVETSLYLMERLKQRVKEERLTTAEAVPELLRQEMKAIVSEAESGSGLVWTESGPTVWLVVGVNGSGKTTSIAKLAYRAGQQGKSVLIAAADTFRAAAGEQLSVWAERVGADLVRHESGSDPGAVVYDALDASIARNRDLVLVDTAGRLHTQKNLMQELSKIRRIIERKLPGAPHEVLQVIDGTTGQNALKQVEQFGSAVDPTGLIVTKLDGTAKGGILLALAHRFKLPVQWIGVGEQMEDLQPFQAQAFIDALFDPA